MVTKCFGALAAHCFLPPKLTLFLFPFSFPFLTPLNAPNNLLFYPPILSSPLPKTSLPSNITSKHCRYPPNYATSLAMSCELWRPLLPSPALSYCCSAVDGSWRCFAAQSTTVSTISSSFFQMTQRIDLNSKRYSIFSQTHISRTVARYLFGEPVSPRGNFCYFFAESSKGYDGLTSTLKLVTTRKRIWLLHILPERGCRQSLRRVATSPPQPVLPVVTISRFKSSHQETMRSGTITIEGAMVGALV